MSVVIQPLSRETLKDAIDLVIRVFPYESEQYIKDTIAAALGFSPRTFDDDDSRCTSLQYFVALDEGANRLVGITGIYTIETDENKAAWISWFCVDTNYRTRGIGKQLLEFTIARARQIGKQFLRLYTEKIPNEMQAHRLYEQYNFEPFEPFQKISSEDMIIYKQLLLKPVQ